MFVFSLCNFSGLVALDFGLRCLAGAKGFEPSIFSVTGRCVRPGYTTHPKSLTYNSRLLTNGQLNGQSIF
jgi:hypothetical protein